MIGKHEKEKYPNTYKVIKEGEKEKVINEKNIKIYHQRSEWMKTGGEEEELDDNEIERLNKEKKIEEKKEKLLIDQKEDGNKETIVNKSEEAT